MTAALCERLVMCVPFGDVLWCASIGSKYGSLKYTSEKRKAGVGAHLSQVMPCAEQLIRYALSFLHELQSIGLIMK